MSKVTIKKSDGTFASVPLEELKKKSSVITTEDSVAEKKTLFAANTPLTPFEGGLAGAPSTAPSEPVSTSPSQDFTSLLEEPVDPAKVSTNQQKSFADEHVVSVLGTLSFAVPADYENRLRTVVQLLIKQVRTDDQTRDVCQRSIGEGGLGLSEKQTDELIALCHEELKKMHPEYGVALPATTTPFNTFKHLTRSSALSPEKKAERKDEHKRSVDILAEIESGVGREPILERTRSLTRPLMNDIIRKPLVMGPIEELCSFTLADIRREAPVLADAFARYSQKFINLRNESVTLFFEARDAYHRGIIFQEYTTILLESLAQKKTIATILAQQNTWKMEEVQELVAMEKRLSL